MFAAALGGRSLQATAEMVFNSGVMAGEQQSEEEASMICAAQQHAQDLFGGSNAPQSAAFLEDVGGQAAWRRLMKALHVAEPVYGGY